MGRPVPKIQGPRRAELKGITRGGDVVHVQFGTTQDQRFHGRGLELMEALDIALDCFEEIAVAVGRHFNGLDVPGAFVADREGIE